MSFRAGAFALALAVSFAVRSIAQEPAPCNCPSPPPPPPPHFEGTLGAGLSLTSGNSDSNSYNLDFKLKYDPKKKGVFKADGLYLRTDTSGEATVDRTSLGGRYEYALGGGRFFAFGEVRYQRDRFQDVDHLVTPSVGLGVRLVDEKNLRLGVDAGVGLAFEKLTGQESTTSGAVSAGQNFLWKFSPVASFVETSRAVWKMDDFGDAYYHFDAGVAASLTKRTELKLGFADDYKSRPPGTNKKNDTSVLATIVFKI
jgi:putative salt-induced outer membrane protein